MNILASNINPVGKLFQLRSSLFHSTPALERRSRTLWGSTTSFGSSTRKLDTSFVLHSQENTASVLHFEDFFEKDWSFLDDYDDDDDDDDDEHIQKKMDRIISSGEIAETSRVLVSAASEAFIDRMIVSSSSPGEGMVLVVHESLFVLACIKEKHDKVKCWQGPLIDVPQKWTSFDVVFLYFLPCLPFELGQILKAIARRCVPGGRVVISHPRGRRACEEQRQQYPDVVVSALPEKTELHAAAAHHSFQVVEFVDEPDFYLAILRLDNQQPEA